tara:strand:+ start:4148 stop:4924 length:777 start_codon:yes stop_codon:yes gene_type:complete
MRVIVEYDPYNRLGNRMFQYAFGLLLAKKYDCELYCNEGLPNFGITPNPISSLQPTLIRARSIGEQYFDFNVLENFDGDVIIDSWVQKAEYYTKDRDLLRKVFGIRDLESINKDELILHIRGTDYNQLGQFLGYKFYKSLIHDSQLTKVKIVTDDPGCETVGRLIQDGCELATAGPGSQFNINGDKSAMDDMKLLLYSENIAISQSSFAWWPAFLGYHKKIIFPYSRRQNKQMWPLDPQIDDADLFFDFNHTCVKYIN